jgi:hypothetical protein
MRVVVQEVVKQTQQLLQVGKAVQAVVVMLAAMGQLKFLLLEEMGQTELLILAVVAGAHL